MLGEISPETWVTNVGVPAAIVLGVLWFAGKPWSDYLRERHKAKAELEDKREERLINAVESNSKTLTKLADNSQAMSENYTGLYAVLKSEAEAQQVMRKDLEGIVHAVGDKNLERKAIIQALNLVESLDSVPQHIQVKLAAVREALED